MYHYCSQALKLDICWNQPDLARKKSSRGCPFSNNGWSRNVSTCEETTNAPLSSYPEEIQPIKIVPPEDLPPLIPVYDDFYEVGDWWADYFSWNDINYTYFDDYYDISREIHERIIWFSEGTDMAHRASGNQTLDVNFQLFIKDVTNLQQQGFTCNPNFNIQCPI